MSERKGMDSGDGKGKGNGKGKGKVKLQLRDQKVKAAELVQRKPCSAKEVMAYLGVASHTDW